jgi:hypothetical protein
MNLFCALSKELTYSVAVLRVFIKRSVNHLSSARQSAFLRVKSYCILVVGPTDMNNEHARVRVGWIHNDHVVRERLNIQVV